MSQTPETELETAAPKGQKNKKALALLTLLFAAAGIIWAVLHFIVWAHEEETEDAYVNGNLVQITAQQPGTVQQIGAEDTDIVKAGQTLLVLDESDARLALEKARSQLIQAVRSRSQQNAGLSVAAAQVAAQKADLGRAQAAFTKAQQDLVRREALRGTDAVSAEELAHARAAADSAQAALNAAQAAVNAAKAQETTQRSAVGKPLPLEQQPEVAAAVSQFKEAWLAVQRTQIQAPVGGQVARRSVQLGQKIGAGVPLMSIVPLHDLWVDANFKETQLADLRIGQKVELTADVYGKDVVFHGTIQGMSAGTGSAFSVLPAQNATGNWIKVVQRVPVRIRLNAGELTKHPLRIGLSMHAKVDTADQGTGAPVSGSQARNTQPQTLPVPDLSEAEAQIAAILEQAR